MLNKNTLDVKKCKANKKQQIMISAEAKKSLITDVLNYFEWHAIVDNIFYKYVLRTISFVTWPPLS